MLVLLMVLGGGDRAGAARHAGVARQPVPLLGQEEVVVVRKIVSLHHGVELDELLQLLHFALRSNLVVGGKWDRLE